MIKKSIALACGFVLGGLSAQAATMDFTDNSFASTPTYAFAGPAGPVVEFSEAVPGGTVTFSPGQFRNIGPWGDGSFADGVYSLIIGGGGGSPASFEMVSTVDITLNGYNGLGAVSGFTTAVFNVTGAGVNSTGNTFTTGGFDGQPGQDYSFAGGALSMIAGETYLFSITNSGSITSSRFYSFDFSVAPVPLPAGAVFLLGGLAAFGVMRRRQTA